MSIPVFVNFTLDIEPASWEDQDVVALDRAAQQRISDEVRRHAEAMVRDHFYDQGWVKDHHPANDYRRADCSWCQEDDGSK